MSKCDKFGENSKIEFRSLKESKKIKNSQMVRVTEMNQIVEVLHLSREPDALLKIKKIDKDHYMNLETGITYEYNKTENRGQNIAGLKETFKTIRNLINNNFTGAENELFITLTYAENMTDTKRLYKDFEIFKKRLKRKYGDIDYLSIVEPQKRGAWHCHVLIRFNGHESVYVQNNDVIWAMWEHGFTKTKNLKDVDNIGAYINAYLTDVEVTDENKDLLISAIMETTDVNGKLEVVEKGVNENGKKVMKKFVKGARLHLYPPGMNLYRSSRGIKKPETKKMLYREVKKIVGHGGANYSRTIELSRDKQPINTITYEQYNLKREKTQ